MWFTAGDLAAVIAELAPRIAGATLEAVQHPRADCVLLRFAAGGGVHDLLLSVHPKFSRAHQTTRHPRLPMTHSGFQVFLGSRLAGAVLRRVEQVPGDRVLRLHLERADVDGARSYVLIAECFGPAANLLLLNAGGIVLQMLRPSPSRARALSVGAPYVPPPDVAAAASPAEAGLLHAAPGVSPPDGFDWNRYFDREFRIREGEEAFFEKREMLRARYLRHAHKLRAKARALRDNRERAGEFAAWRRHGELLKANFHRLRKGMASVAVTDYFRADQPVVEMPLDPLKSPAENIDRYFRQARKLEGAIVRLDTEIAAVERELAAVDAMGVTARLDAAAVMNDLIPVEDELVFARILTHPKKKGIRAPRETGFRRFLTEQGVEIHVGRNNTDNDKLTLRFARGNDWWAHVSGFPGSHVVLRMPRDRELTQEMLLDMAQLAKHYSKARDAGRAEIHYTRRKHVHKPRGARPGLVTLATWKTIIVANDPARLDRLRYSTLSGSPELLAMDRDPGAPEPTQARVLPPEAEPMPDDDEGE